MKKMLITAFCVAPLGLFAQNAFTIKGDVKSLKDGDKIYFVYNKAGARVIDSTMVKGGKFSLSGDVDKAGSANLFLNKNPFAKGTDTKDMEYSSFFLEKGNLTVNGDGKLSEAKVSGTPTNESMQKFAAIAKPLQDEMKELQQGAAKLGQTDTAGFMALREKYIAVQDKLSQQIVDYANANPKDLYSGLLLRQVIKNEKHGADALAAYKKLDQKVLSDPSMAPLAQMVSAIEKTGVGSQAIDFTQNDANGNPVKLSDFKGKYVLLDFWASWCGPCRQENPNVVAAYNKFKDKGFTVLGVSLDGGSTRTTKEAWLAAVAKDGLVWTQVSDLQGWTNSVAVQYGINSIPASFLIGPDGKIIAKDLRGKDLEDKLAQLLEKSK